MLPLQPAQAFGDTGSLVLSLGIGFCFGFVLERAGFGNSRKLAAQFYFHDMTVFKVMFTAILVAMIGIQWGSALGLVDYGQIWVNPTHLIPGIVGGLLLGFGFIIGGYCPGTSIVSASTGKLDGMAFLSGVVFGIMVFAEVMEPFRGFWEANTNWGRVTLPEIFGLNPGVIVFLISLVALGCFMAAEYVEGLLQRPVGPTATEPESKTEEVAA